MLIKKTFVLFLLVLVALLALPGSVFAQEDGGCVVVIDDGTGGSTEIDSCDVVNPGPGEGPVVGHEPADEGAAAINEPNDDGYSEEPIGVQPEPEQVLYSAPGALPVIGGDMAGSEQPVLYNWLDVLRLIWHVFIQ